MLQFDKEAITSMCKCLANKMYHTVLGIAKKKKKKNQILRARLDWVF